MWVPVLSWNTNQLFWYIRRWPLHSLGWWSHACVIISNITCHSNSLQMCFFSFASPLNSYSCIQLLTVHLHLEPRRWLKLDRFNSESDTLTLICLLYSSLCQKMATLSIGLARNLGITLHCPLLYSIPNFSADVFGSYYQNISVIFSFLTTSQLSCVSCWSRLLTGLYAHALFSVWSQPRSC